MTTLKCKRAVYGKVPYPMDMREYNILSSPNSIIHEAVGCINELREWAKTNGYDKLELEDLDGTYLVDVETGKITKGGIVQYCGWCGCDLGDYEDWKGCLCPECTATIDDHYDGDMEEAKRQRAKDHAEEVMLEEAREADYEKKEELQKIHDFGINHNREVREKRLPCQRVRSC